MTNNLTLWYRQPAQAWVEACPGQRAARRNGVRRGVTDERAAVERGYALVGRAKRLEQPACA